VEVGGILAVIVEDIVVRQQPSDVHVAAPRGLTTRVKRLPTMLSSAHPRGSRGRLEAR
jgi:hypothetical protein